MAVSLPRLRPFARPSLSCSARPSVRTKTLNNLQSARISVPPLLKDISATSATTLELPLVWRADLAATEPFWRGEPGSNGNSYAEDMPD